MIGFTMPELPEATRIVESAEANAWIELMKRVPADIAEANGIAVKEFGGAVGFTLRTVPHWSMNRVMGLGLDQPATRAQLDEILRYYRERELPLGISLVPHARPAEVADWLQDAGFELANVWAKMIRDNSPIPDRPIDYPIVEMTAKDARRFAETACTGFGMPPFCVPVFETHLQVPGNHVYAVMDGDEVAAVGALTITDGSGNINTTTTLSNYQGKGLQGALMAHSINEGIRHGCRWFATETGLLPGQVNHSYNNMVRTGFRMVYERPNYILG